MSHEPTQAPAADMSSLDAQIATGFHDLPDHWDEWDLIVFLGLETKQPDVVQREAPGVDSKTAHRHATSAEGKIIWENPRNHWLRSQCRMPFFNRVQQDNRDDPDDPFDKGHTKPMYHQLHAVALFFARAFCADPQIHRVSSMILADEPGLGKTMILIFIIALHRYYSLRCRKDPNYYPPVMHPIKAALFPRTQGEGEDSSRLAFLPPSQTNL